MAYLNATLVGILTGSAYALVSVSITLMFRSTGVLSFAHAGFAAVGAYVYAELAGSHGWSPSAAAVVALLVTTGYGLIVERVAIRPVRHASSTTKLIATLGVLALTTGILLQVFGFEPTSAPVLLPDETFRLGDLRIPYQQVAILVIAAGACGLLGAFLQRTRFGIAVRAVAQNSESARLMGVSLVQVARFNWALGAALAGMTGILIAPLQVITVATFPLVLAKSLTATLFGGLLSLPLSFVGGLVVGVLESITVLETNSPGAKDLVVLLLVVVLLVVRKEWPSEATDASDETTSGRRLRLPEPLTRLFAAAARIRSAGRPLLVPAAAIALVIAVVVPANSNYWGFVGARGLFYVIEALSLVLIAGWGGQTSLMHGAYVGIGAFVAAYLIQTHDMGVAPACILAGVAGMALGALAGLPALRLTSLQFAIASLAFAGAASEWLFKQPEFPNSIPRGTLLGIDLFSDSSVYLVMLPVTAVLYLVVWNLRRSTFGPLLISSRDASTTVAHFGANPRRTRMAAFMLASFIAALGGALYGVLLTGFQPFDFSLLLSIALLLNAVVGGITSLGGPLIAGVVFGVIPQLLQGQSGTTASALPDIIAGTLVIGLVAFRPDGLASLFTKKHGQLTADADHPARPLRLGRFDAVIEDRLQPAPRTAPPELVAR